MPFLMLFIWFSVLLWNGVGLASSDFLCLTISVAPCGAGSGIPVQVRLRYWATLQGASVGYILEKEKVRSVTSAPLLLQFVKVILGLVAFILITALGSILQHGGTGLDFAAATAGLNSSALPLADSGHAAGTSLLSPPTNKQSKPRDGS